jgi:heme peroxidase
MRAAWYGLLGERVHRAFGLTGNEVLNGIPGSGVQHFGVPYSLTEEFGIVYRMHPLIPDDYRFWAAVDDRPLAEHSLRDLSGPAALRVLGAIPMHDLLYSFGVSHPGALVLGNYPRFLQEFLRPDGELTDLAATDILRTREFGVPRYNEFRRLLHLRPAASFDELTGDRVLAATLADLYAGDVEQVDTIVGMFAEKRPAGFAFSDTAFRIFIVMAARRINSDRFLAEDFRPEVYTPVGFAWVEDNDMVSVLLRHHPQLRASLRGVANPFAPWKRPA